MISKYKNCNVCMEMKQVVAESLFANGLYGYWCAECDKAEQVQDEIYKLNKKLITLQERVNA